MICFSALDSDIFLPDGFQLVTVACPHAVRETADVYHPGPFSFSCVLDDVNDLSHFSDPDVGISVPVVYYIPLSPTRRRCRRPKKIRC